MHSQAPTPVDHDRVRDYQTRVIVAGSREFENYKLFSTILDELLPDYGDSVVFISGCADGPDSMIIQWCQERGQPWAEYPADWGNLDVPDAVVRTSRSGRKYNARAGLDRNVKMGDVGTHLLAFWNQRSSGTRHMRAYAILRKLKVQTVLVDQDE